MEGYLSILFSFCQNLLMPADSAQEGCFHEIIKKAVPHASMCE